MTLELGARGGTIRFRNAQELEAHLATEWGAWNWLASMGQLPQRAGGPLNEILQAWNTYAGQHNNVIGLIGRGNVDQAFEIIKTMTGQFIPFSRSPEGELALKVHKELGLAPGVGAVGALKGYRIDAENTGQFRGAFIATQFLERSSKTAQAAFKQSIDAGLDRLARQQLRAEDLTDQLFAKIEDADVRRRRQFTDFLKVGSRVRKRYSQEIGGLVEQLSNDAKAVTDDLATVKKTYEEFMRLKAPVDYWRGKANDHRVKSRVAASVGLAFAGVVLLGLYGWGITYVMKLIEDAINQTHQLQIAYVVLTVVAFVLSILFWVGRLISRTYISESHLAVDAEERATMVETYLALTKDDQMSSAERVLVLASLFRASSDGLVKDDGGPSMSLAGLLSQLATAGSDGKKT